MEVCVEVYKVEYVMLYRELDIVFKCIRGVTVAGQSLCCVRCLLTFEGFFGQRIPIPHNVNKMNTMEFYHARDETLMSPYN